MLLYMAGHCRVGVSNVLDRYRNSDKGLYDREDRLVIDRLRTPPGFLGVFPLEYGDGKIGRALKWYTNGGAAKHGKINLRRQSPLANDKSTDLDPPTAMNSPAVDS